MSRVETSKALYWQEQLAHAQKTLKNWETRADKVVERFRDERPFGQRTKTKFNILWSNIQVLKPSLYGRPAKPEVTRRFNDADPVGRLASTMLERVLDYEIRQFPDFDDAMQGTVEDRLLPGRGTAWLRFSPVIDGETMDSAHSPVDYIYWKDFRHSPARTWAEVWWVARAAYMTREAGVREFGPGFNNVTLDDYGGDSGSKRADAEDNKDKTARVWEIWNKRDGKVCWLAESFPRLLKEEQDPLQLEGFFPCPTPLYATITNGSLIPIPDYCQYQDQGEELDILTGRISKLAAAIKAVGVYNAEYKELARLFKEGTDNTLIPVDQWGSLAEKGGLEGAVDLLDLTTQLQALGALYTAREATKQTIWEICGISDILRGQTKAEETLGAQQLKANFGSLRLRSSQVDVARFASDIFRLKAQIICKFYPGPLIAQMSGILQTSEGQDQALVMQALELLANSTIRDFHIEVESDSLAQVDDDAEKAAATEAIGAIAGFLQQAVPMVGVSPETLPMVSEMLLFLVRRFRAGRQLESAIERTMTALTQKAAAAAQNPQPTPEQVEAQVQAQADRERMQMEAQNAQLKAQMEAQVQQGKLQQEMQLETLKAEQEERLAGMERQFKLVELKNTDERERFKAEMQALTALAVAEVGAKAQSESSDKALEGTKIKKIPAKDPQIGEIADKLKQVETILSQPRSKGKKVIRDAEGRIDRVEEIQ